MTRVSFTLPRIVVLVALSLTSVSALGSDDAAPASSGKVPVPDITAQRDARKRVNEGFADDIAKAKTPDDKAAVAKKLLQAGSEAKNDPTGKYMMLSMARDLAVAAGDADTALSAISEMDAFAIDAWKLKVDTLTVILKSVGDPQDALTIAARIGPLIDEAIGTDHYTIARQLADMAVSAARSAKDADALTLANARLAEVKEIDAAAIPAQKAAATLSTNPKDAAASLTLGRFEAFVRRHWEKGLPLLASGSDANLKGLAQAELFTPPDTDKQILLADGWWNASIKERGLAQVNLRQHAAHWYKVALPSLSGLPKVRVEKRIKESQSSQGTYTGWVDLLRKVKIERDTVTGKWSLDGGLLSVSDGAKPARLKIPMKPNKNYELRVEYQRPGGGNILGIYLPVGDTAVCFMITTNELGLDVVDGTRYSLNESSKAGDFGSDKKKHVLDIAVWQGERDARIIVLFDGKQQMDWHGPSSRLRINSDWLIPEPMTLALGANDTPFVFYGIGLREIVDPEPPLPSKK